MKESLLSSDLFSFQSLTENKIASIKQCQAIINFLCSTNFCNKGHACKYSGLFLTEQETGYILCILKQECLHELIFIQKIKVSRGEDILINHFPSENSPPSLLSLVIFLVSFTVYTVNNISFKIFLI